MRKFQGQPWKVGPKQTAVATLILAFPYLWIFNIFSVLGNEIILTGRVYECVIISNTPVR